MEENQFLKQVRLLWNGLALFFTVIIIIGSLLFVDIFYPESSIFRENSNPPTTENKGVPDSLMVSGSINTVNGIHQETGFVAGNGLEEVINNCTNCHSAKLVTQNRMTREGWLTTIRWMQETQNLWDLGDQEDAILNYLAENYAPTEEGRRRNLEIEEWYVLEE